MIYRCQIDENLNGESIRYQVIYDEQNSTIECRLNRLTNHRKEYFVSILFFIILLSIVQVQQKVKLESVERFSSFLLLPSVLLTIYLLVKLFFGVKRETLLFNKQIGLQITTTSFIGRTTTKFIHVDRIENLLINEGFHSQRVIYYLTLILRGDDEKTSMLTLFPHLLPRLDFLKTFYQRFSLCF